MTAKATKRIVCLANSRKLSGRCIAGKEIQDDGRGGDWIRPVSDRDSQEVSEWERQYEDGSDPCILDVIDVPVLKAQPKDYQQENWLLDPEYYWQKIHSVTTNELTQFIDPAAPLWINQRSSAHGRRSSLTPLPVKRRKLPILSKNPMPEPTSGRAYVENIYPWLHEKIRCHLLWTAA